MIELRSAVESDIPFLLWLRQETMSEHLINSGIEIDSDSHLARVMYKFNCAEIILIDGNPAGLLKIVRGETLWELIQIQISPEFQSRGIGKLIIEQVLAEAKKITVNVKLSVLKTNPAKVLYERLGFKIVSEGQSEYFMKFVI